MKTGTAGHWDTVAARLEAVRDVAREFAGEVRAHFGARLRDIRLFGSAARGDWQDCSDVDVLVLLDEVRGEDRGWLATLAARRGVLSAGFPLSTVTLPESEFEHLRQRERLFAIEVDREGMPL